MTLEHGDDTVATNKAWHDGKSGNRDRIIQFNVSNPAMNHVVHFMSYHVMSNQVLPSFDHSSTIMHFSKIF
jgi:hypothetical protein